MAPPPTHFSFPTSLCPFSPLPLRVALCSPVFPRLFSDGGAAWSEDGKTGWSVQSSLGLFRGKMSVFGFMPVAGRVLDLLGQIWCYLGAILLAKLLRRSEVSAMRSSSIVDFPNKAPIHGDGLSWCGGVGMFLLPCWYGANIEEGYVNVAVHDCRLSHRISELHLGGPHMVAMAGYHDSRLKRRPLQTLLMACVQPPLRRPFTRFSLVFNVLAAPSGYVPRTGKGGRGWSPLSSGGEDGPNRVSCLVFRVLLVKSEEYFVIFLFSGILCNLYPHRQ
jgi:hypothetical protein